MRFLISGIKPTTSVTTEIAPKGVGAARNYATSTIRITTLKITFHPRWMVLVELAFLFKKVNLYSSFLVIKTFYINFYFDKPHLSLTSLIRFFFWTKTILGSYLLSRFSVPLAQLCLTSLFGMGRDGTIVL